MRTADVWKIFLLYFLKAVLSLRNDWWLFLIILVSLCWYFLYPFIIPQTDGREHYSGVKNEKVCPSLHPYSIFLRIYLLKMSCGKRIKWHFRDLKALCPQRLALRTPSKSHATLLACHGLYCCNNNNHNNEWIAR